MPPKVSILMITYNQERYISQAIESVLSQQTDFSYEIVVGEDFSTDNTREVCREYQQRYPDKIRLLERDRNLGMAGNFLSTFKECNGQYLAVLEGDDYWVNPHKLQSQVDFLDIHPDFALVFGRTFAFYQNDDRPGYEIPPSNVTSYTLENLLALNYIATCSVMYRNGIINEYPVWLNKLDMLDWPMHVLHAQYGKIGFIDALFSNYRIHLGSGYSTRNILLNYKGILTFYRTINRHLNYGFASVIFKAQSDIYSAISLMNPVDVSWTERKWSKFLRWYFAIKSRTVAFFSKKAHR